MTRYIHMEENDDGTITMTSNVNGEEKMGLLPIGFDKMMELMAADPSTIETLNLVAKDTVIIPNNVGEYVELTGDDIPYHLRSDSEALAICDKCGRETWDADLIDTTDRMTQPSGQPCGGVFRKS